MVGGRGMRRFRQGANGNRRGGFRSNRGDNRLNRPNRGRRPAIRSSNNKPGNFQGGRRFNKRTDNRQDKAERRRFRGGKRRNLTKEKLDQDLDSYWRKSDELYKNKLDNDLDNYFKTNKDSKIESNNNTN